MNVDLDGDSEEQRPTQLSMWRSLRRDTHWKCLILSVLIVGCLAAIAWCRLTEVTKVVVNFANFPITSTRQTSPCDDGYIYIPMAFLVTLYLVYLVECWHCTARLDLKYKVQVAEVYERLEQMRDALPIIWWKAICYHYVRRTRQVTRYRNGDAYTTTQVYYERVNSHSAGASFVFSQCGVRDISKQLLDLEKYPVTRIRCSKSFAFANLEAANEFEEQRARFFQENERYDDYMEMREGLELANVNFREHVVAFADHLPCYLAHDAFWIASALLLSWPLRVLLSSKTAHAHYHITKLFGVNYTTPGSTQRSGLTNTGGRGLAPTNYGYLTPSISTSTSADLEWTIRNNFNAIPTYSEALLMEGAHQRSLLRHQSCLLVPHSDSNANFSRGAHLARAISSSTLANVHGCSRSGSSSRNANRRRSWNFSLTSSRPNAANLPSSATRFSLQSERISYQTMNSSSSTKPADSAASPPDYDVAIRVCRPVILRLPRSVTDRDFQTRSSRASVEDAQQTTRDLETAL